MSKGEAFVQWVFSKNSTTACPTWTQAFACPAPKACGRNPANLRQFCCETDSRICWGPRATCASDGSTVTCGTGSGTWCCVSGSEICTQAPGQINICWSTTESIIQNISVDALQSTYSALSSASPAASSFSFDPQALIAATATTSSTRTSPTSSPTNSATDSSSPSAGGGASSQNSGVPSTSPVANSDSGLGGGAIAGIVVGVLGALAIGAVIGYFVMRAMKKKKEGAAGAPPVTDPSYMSMTPGGPGGGPPPGAVYPPYGQYQPTELGQKWEYQQPYSPYSATTTSPVQAQELPAQRESYAEMPTQRYQ